MAAITIRKAINIRISFPRHHQRRLFLKTRGFAFCLFEWATRDEAPGMFAALKHAAFKLPSYSLPPLIALAGTAVFALQMVVLGFVMRLSVLAFLAALAWPIVPRVPRYCLPEL